MFQLTKPTHPYRLREESTLEATKAHQLVSSLRAEPHILTLTWREGKPASGKVQTMAREKRYKAMLEQCRLLGIDTLMLGHHADDQNGV